MPLNIPISQSRKQNRANPPVSDKTLQKLKVLQGEHDIAVGLSGGVDSSLTAALFVDAGWKVSGITLWLMSGKGSCCSDGLIDAAGICDQLKIAHHVIDSRKTFEKEIIQEVINGYQNGLTPIPCSRCNRSVKFNSMLDWAKENLNVNRLATGHYARIEYATKEIQHSTKAINLNQDRHKLLRGLDAQKDQSYFLYDLSQEVLGRVIFPLGEMTKRDTRIAAIKYGLRTAEKPESQDLCLAEHHGSMKAFIDNYIQPKRGEIILKDGSILGEHDGIQHFTIGQRKGLKVSWKEPLHVIQIDSTKNQVIVAPRADSSQSECIVGEVNWISIPPPKTHKDIQIQIRYRSRPVDAKLIPIEPTLNDIKRDRPYRCKIIFKNEEFSITPGQAAVFYDDEIVMGGGLIQPFTTNNS